MIVLYTLIFAVLGILRPEQRGALLTSMIFLFVFMGVFAGYYSARFYKMLGGTQWLKNSLLTAFLFPGFVLIILFAVNIVLSSENSSARVLIFLH